MKPGIYRLTKTIKNPKPDRRKEDWQFEPEWAAGSPFFVEPDPVYDQMMHLSPGAGRKEGT